MIIDVLYVKEEHNILNTKLQKCDFSCSLVHKFGCQIHLELFHLDSKSISEQNHNFKHCQIIILELSTEDGLQRAKNLRLHIFGNLTNPY